MKKNGVGVFFKFILFFLIVMIPFANVASSKTSGKRGKKYVVAKSTTKTKKKATRVENIEPAKNIQSFQDLYESIVRHSESTDGTVGVGIIHLETGRELYLNREERFPMASAVKVPLGVQLMTMVDQKRVSLDSLVVLKKNDFHPGSGHIKYNSQPGTSLSLDYLVEKMITVSDNSATDILFRVVGGASAVDQRMKMIGIDGMSVDRPIFLVLGNCWGVNDLKEDEPLSSEEILSMRAKVSQSERLKARKEYITDTRDTCTPEAMAKLLAKIWNYEILSVQSSNYLLDYMGKSKGKKRIKALLPAGTKVYHKTGTINGGLSDVGIIELPNDAGHVVVAVFVKGGRTPMYQSEMVISKIARDAYDYFYKNSSVD